MKNSRDSKGRFKKGHNLTKRSLFWDKKWLSQKYLKEELSPKQIAKICNIKTIAYIRKKIKEFGFPKIIRVSKEGCENKRLARIGKRHSEETKEKMRLAQLREKGHNWKGGVMTDRFMSPWKQRRKKALRRDNYTCQNCGKKSGEIESLEVHHKIPFRFFSNPIEAHELYNLVTLCRKCHRMEESKKTIIDSKFGKGCIVWNYVNIYGADFGNNVSIGSFSEIGKNVKIGNNVKIGAHSFIPEGYLIEDEVFWGPSSVGTNDKRPMAVGNWKCLSTYIRKGVSIGANCTILPGITIGKYASIGAGSVVTRDVESHSLVYGCPARKRKRHESFSNSPNKK